MSTLTRRSALYTMAGAACLRAESSWANLPEILKRIQAPKFPARDFEIAKYGAKEGAKVDNPDAFRKSIEAASKAGGGRVVAPPGVWLTGAIHLRSNVNL